MNATSTGRTIAMYVPTVGMNCDTMPTQRPSASEYGTPSANRNAHVTSAEMTAWMPREYR